MKRPSSQSSFELLSQPGVPGIEEYEEIGCSKEMQMIIDKVRKENKQFERIHNDEERVIMGKPPLRRPRVRRIFRTSKIEGTSYSPSQLATGVMTPSEKPLVKSYAKKVVHMRENGDITHCWAGINSSKSQSVSVLQRHGHLSRKSML